MAEIGAYDAKTHLPQLLERVQRGERFVITKHGRPVAELVPVTERDPDKTRNLLVSMRSLRASLGKRGVRLSDIRKKGETLRELAHDDHRY